jgi:hypothetical protein
VPEGVRPVHCRSETMAVINKALAETPAVAEGDHGHCKIAPEDFSREAKKTPAPIAGLRARS